MDPVPDPLLLRKSGSAGNRTRDLCVFSQELWPLDHRDGKYTHLYSFMTVSASNAWFYNLILIRDLNVFEFWFWGCLSMLKVFWDWAVLPAMSCLQTSEDRTFLRTWLFHPSPWHSFLEIHSQKRNVYRLLVGKPEGKRPLGRPRRRWIDNIKMNLLEIGLSIVDWIGLAQDRYSWRALVNSVMNLRVP
jgi:hypothetical protein